jgi:nucleotide-binding universal stress UspA family protein
MSKIVLAVDGSEHALHAAAQLVAMAGQWKEQPEILPINVHAPLPRANMMAKVVGKSELQRFYHESGEAAMKAVLKLLEKAGYTTKPVIQIGPVAETIVAHAKRSKADMICIGTRGMSASGNLLLGSVATKVLHLAECPVLTIK